MNKKLNGGVERQQQRTLWRASHVGARRGLLIMLLSPYHTGMGFFTESLTDSHFKQGQNKLEFLGRWCYLGSFKTLRDTQPSFLHLPNSQIKIN
jgi:hypothetical protein